jgi:hypothetical protein
MTRLTEIAADICSVHSSYGMSGEDVVRGLLGPRMTRKAELTRAGLVLLKDPSVGNSRVQQEAMAKILRRRSEVPRTQAKEDSTAQVAEMRRVVVLEKPGVQCHPR